ncbi:MAG TPA: YggT family protein [bacterium]|jgi:YggT family protein|nr:YggT family protein [bacterium]
MQGILFGLADVLGYLIQAAQILVLAYWILSLVGADPGNPIVAFVRAVVEPPAAWLRRRLPFLVVGAWDLSLFAIVLILIFLNRALVDNVRLAATRF